MGTQEKHTELESESNIFIQKGEKSELALFNGPCPIVHWDSPGVEEGCNVPKKVGKRGTMEEDGAGPLARPGGQHRHHHDHSNVGGDVASG